jgi:hypothetical protein
MISFDLDIGPEPIGHGWIWMSAIAAVLILALAAH